MTIEYPPSFDMAKLLLDSRSNFVDARESRRFGKPSLHVTLDDKTAHGVADVDFVDMPTFLEFPVEFEFGTISVDLVGALRTDAPDYARGFAGIAYHINESTTEFEAVYLRPLNGSSLQPPPPRSVRAVQYFAFPEWRYQRLRDEYPDGRYECAAEIKPDQWINLKLEISRSQVLVHINDKLNLVINDLKAVPAKGRIGLFVDIGTDGYFANLQVTPG